MRQRGERETHSHLLLSVYDRKEAKEEKKNRKGWLRYLLIISDDGGSSGAPSSSIVSLSRKQKGNVNNASQVSSLSLKRERVDKTLAPLRSRNQSGPVPGHNERIAVQRQVSTGSTSPPKFSLFSFSSRPNLQSQHGGGEGKGKERSERKEKKDESLGSCLRGKGRGSPGQICVSTQHSLGDISLHTGNGCACIDTGARICANNNELLKLPPGSRRVARNTDGGPHEAAAAAAAESLPEPTGPAPDKISVQTQHTATEKEMVQSQFNKTMQIQKKTNKKTNTTAKDLLVLW